MALPNINPRVADTEETMESYCRRMISYLVNGDSSQMLTALEAYTSHVLPHSEEPAMKRLYPEWLKAMHTALHRDIAFNDTLPVFECLIHSFPNEDVLPIATEFFEKLGDQELEEAFKNILNIQED